MHLAWFFILPLIFAAWPWRQREAARAWMQIGFAGVIFLLPTLKNPDLIPSPAGSLAHSAPWRATGDPADGNRELRDITYQVQPWMLYLRQELREGRIPYWNPFQYAGTPYWSNGSSAPIFPLHLLFAALPLSVGFVLIPWLRILIGGWGAWWLARQLGVSWRGSLIAGIAFPLSGMLISHLLFPMANALMLVPWIFWAVERWLVGQGTWRPITLFGALQLLAGHPETALHTCLLTAVYALARGANPFWRKWTGLVGGWGLGALVASVQLVPLALTLFASTRWLPREPGVRAPLELVSEQMLRLILPNLQGMPSRGDFWGPVIYVATAIYVGILTLLLAGVAASKVKTDPRWRGVGTVLLFAFLGAYHLPPIYDLMLPLPLIGQAPQHRLIFAVALTLSLFGAAGFDRWLEGQHRRALTLTGLTFAVLLGICWIRFFSVWTERQQFVEQGAWTNAWVATFALLLLGHLLFLTRYRLAKALPLLLAIDLSIAHHQINPDLNLKRLYPTTGAVAFLQDQDGRVAGEGSSLHANAGMVYRISDVRGDESIKMAHYERYYAAFSRRELIYSLPIRDWQHPHLDQLGLRWVLTGPKDPPIIADWRLAYEGSDAKVYERPNALLLARWTDSQETAPQVEEQEPGHWRLSYSLEQPRTLLIAECWDAGWKATVDGKEVAIRQLDDIFLGIDLEAGSGIVELRYRPHGLGLGLALTLFGLVLLLPFEKLGNVVQRDRPSDATP